MQYDRKKDVKGVYVMSSNISCAFNEVRDTFSAQVKGGGWDYWTDKPRPVVHETQEELEDRLWDTLCDALMASETRPVLIPTKDNEVEMRNLLSACPYVQLLSESRSKHGNYKVQLWFIPVHAKGE